MVCQLTLFVVFKIVTEELGHRQLDAAKRCTKLMRYRLVKSIELAGHQDELIILFQNIGCTDFIVTVIYCQDERLFFLNCRVE